MKKTKTFATIAVALVAGVSILAACARLDNEPKDEKTAEIMAKDLSDDEMDELMQSADAKVTVSDSGGLVTSCYYSDGDYCVKSYRNNNGTSFAGLCQYRDESKYSFKRISNTEIEFSYDDLKCAVFLTEMVFDEQDGCISFGIKARDVEYPGATIEVSTTMLSKIKDFVNEENDLSLQYGKAFGKALLTYLLESDIDLYRNSAKEAKQIIERFIKDCIEFGGRPRIAYKSFPQSFSYDCNGND
ncbi:MAG: hypothetical protein IKX51_06150 [Bacteroidales bacterium]|nr:hypothetical protein [Bacteroidales bacterium]